MDWRINCSTNDHHFPHDVTQLHGEIRERRREKYACRNYALSLRVTTKLMLRRKDLLNELIFIRFLSTKMSLTALRKRIKGLNKVIQ